MPYHLSDNLNKSPARKTIYQKTIMTVRNLFFLLSISLLLIISFTIAKAQFGLQIIDNTADATITNERISKIRSLDNNTFEAATFADNEAKNEIKYRLFKPAKNDTRKYPLVIFFHGSGAIGADNISQLGILPKLFASPEIQKKYPAYLLAPQFSDRSSDYVLDKERNTLASVPRSSLATVLKLIDSLKQNLNIDEKRIYAVGFSMGGSTVINSLQARPDLFAAGISISGIPQFSNIEKLSTIPIWLIHGMDDTENPINSDEQFYKEMNKKKVRFWKLKAITHDNVFTPQLLDNTLPKWLFKQRKK